MNAKLIPLLLASSALFAQVPPARPKFDAFEVATIKPTEPNWTGGRYMTMKGGQFAGKNYQIRVLLAAAYSLIPDAITGGPAWLDSDHYDVVAKTPGGVKPTPDEYMSMLRQLLDERFQLKFHREPKEFPVYALTIAKGGPKLREPGPAPDGPQPLIFTLSPGNARLPARDATMAELVAVMQRTAVPRPVLDKTGLTGRYDFDLTWTPDETQFNGVIHPIPESTEPDLFAAIQQQLGLRLEATRGTVDTIVIDKIERPTEN
jgi:uncharacterized protein (TIGR03435 family)